MCPAFTKSYLKSFQNLMGNKPSLDLPDISYFSAYKICTSLTTTVMTRQYRRILATEQMARTKCHMTLIRGPYIDCPGLLKFYDSSTVLPGGLHQVSDRSDMTWLRKSSFLRFLFSAFSVFLFMFKKFEQIIKSSKQDLYAVGRIHPEVSTRFQINQT